MTWKLALDVGYFEPDGRIARPLEPAFVQQVIVQAGGLLLDQLEGPRNKIARRWERARIASGNGRRALGYLGEEEVSLHPTGYLFTAIGSGPNPAALAFLRMMVAEGCLIWTEDGESTQRTFDNLAATDARWAALKKA